GSTGIGGGVGVPHAKLEGVKNVIGAFGRASSPFDFNAVDGQPVNLIFLIIAPPSKNEAYLKALQKVMSALKKPNFVKFLRGAKTVRDIEEIFREVEEVAVRTAACTPCSRNDKSRFSTRWVSTSARPRSSP